MYALGRTVRFGFVVVLGSVISVGLRFPGTKCPARPADERGRGTTSWFGVRCRLPGPWRPSWRANGRLPHGSRATFTRAGVPRGSHRPALALGPCPALLLSVVAVRARV